MFRNFTLLLMLYFVVSVGVIIGVYSVLIFYFNVTNYFSIIAILFTLTLLLAYILIQLSIEPLEEYIEDLNHFSKEVLHELNIPIATIKMNTQLLEKSIHEEKMTKRLNRIKAATTLLELRYKELEYLIKKKAFMDVVEVVVLDVLVKERVENLSQLFRDVDFRLNLEKFSLKVDKIGLIKVIDNLIENAIKYSNKPVVIEINLHGYELEIVDYGIGMDEVTLLKVFDGFYQENSSSEGYGIGLKVIKRYCDSNKIALHVRSKKDIGTQVRLNFKGKEIANNTTA